MSKERNIETQKMLRAEGLYKGKLDGVIGPLTRRALELHNKQQYQPLPRQRPSGVSAKGSAAASGGPGSAMTARGQIVPPMAAMPPMPDSSAFINDPTPSYGGPNPETAIGIRDALNAAIGQKVFVDPLKPAYAPGFSDVPSGSPLDDFELRNEMARRRAIGPLSMNDNPPVPWWDNVRPMGPMTDPVGVPGSRLRITPVPTLRPPSLSPRPPKPANDASLGQMLAMALSGVQA